MVKIKRDEKMKREKKERKIIIIAIIFLVYLTTSIQLKCILIQNTAEIIIPSHIISSHITSYLILSI